MMGYSHEFSPNKNIFTKKYGWLILKQAWGFIEDFHSGIYVWNLGESDRHTAAG